MPPVNMSAMEAQRQQQSANRTPAAQTPSRTPGGGGQPQLDASYMSNTGNRSVRSNVSSENGDLFGVFKEQRGAGNANGKYDYHFQNRNAYAG